MLLFDASRIRSNIFSAQFLVDKNLALPAFETQFAVNVSLLEFDPLSGSDSVSALWHQRKLRGCPSQVLRGTLGSA